MNNLMSLILLAVTIYRPMEAWIVPQPPTNVWVTLAKALNQDHLCLSTSSVANPFLSCLVGIPYPLDNLPFSFPKNVTAPRNRSTQFQSVQLNAPHEWRVWYRSLPILDEEPQEVSPLGSALAYTCVQFFSVADPHPIVKSRPFLEIKQSMKEYTAGEWCLKVIQIDAATNYEEQPRKLPKGTFFLCGNRAWACIPSRLLGGPCTFGQLTLFTPNKTQIAHWQEVNSTGNLARSKRDTNFRTLDEDCNDEIFHWDQTKSVLITTFIPWWSIAQSLNELKGLECWVAKQANITSAALSGLLEDEKVTRQTTLQNRAAIDYLLLLHNHRCEEFAGMCCFNLSSKAEDVCTSITKMKKMISHIKQEPSDWLGSVFSGWGLSNLGQSVLKFALILLFALMVFVIGFSIIKRLVLDHVNAAINSTPQVCHAEMTLLTTNEDPEELKEVWFEV